PSRRTALGTRRRRRPLPRAPLADRARRRPPRDANTTSNDARRGARGPRPELRKATHAEGRAGGEGAGHRGDCAGGCRQQPAGALERAGIRYVAVPKLAGRRGKGPAPSPRPCWRNRGFRNYADHMRTAEFRAGIRKLLGLARRSRTAVMCAEAVPWRCHRSLIADYLVVQQTRRVDELVGDRLRPHQVTICARIERGKLTYDLA